MKKEKLKAAEVLGVAVFASLCAIEGKNKILLVWKEKLLNLITARVSSAVYIDLSSLNGECSAFSFFVNITRK